VEETPEFWEHITALVDAGFTAEQIAGEYPATPLRTVRNWMRKCHNNMPG
jgi:hypothetical protein